MRRAVLLAGGCLLALSALATGQTSLAVSAPARATGRVPVRVSGEGTLEVRLSSGDFVPATVERRKDGVVVWNARADLRARGLVRADAVLRVRRGSETAVSEPVSVDLFRWERFAGRERAGNVGTVPALDAAFLFPSQLACDGAKVLVADPFAMRVWSVASSRVEALAGNGLQRHGALEGRSARETALDFPRGVAVDANHVVFIASSPSNEVLAVDPARGTVSVVASAGLVMPRSLAVLASPAAGEPGVLLIAEDVMSRVRRLRYTYDGSVKPLGVDVLVGAEKGPPRPGDADGPCGPGGAARVRGPQGLCVADGAVLVADSQNHRVRRLVAASPLAAPGEWRLETVAGTVPGFAGDGGPAREARLALPIDVAFDPATKRVFIADALNHRVRCVDREGRIATLADAFVLPNGLSWGEGALLVSDAGVRRIVAVRDGKVEALAGRSVVVPADGAPADEKELSFPHVGAVQGRSLYVSEIANYVSRIDLVTGEVQRLAGDGVLASRGDGAAATSASLAQPIGVAVSAEGVVYVCERIGHRVRQIGRDGIIRAFAGTGRPGSTGDGGPALEATLDGPHGIACSPASGAVYVSEFSGNRIRRIAKDGTIATVCGTGSPVGPRPDGVPATKASIQRVVALAVGPGEVVYYAESGAHLVRKFEPGGAVSTVAGVPFATGYDGDDVPASGARLDSPTGVAVDRDGAVFIADTGNHRLRRVREGRIVAIAGDGSTGTGPFGGEPLAAANAFLGEMALDEGGDLYVTDILAGQVDRLAIR